MMKNKILFLFLLLSGYYLSSCSGDDDIVQNDITITFSQNEYKVRKGKTLEIVPQVTNATNPIYSWKLNGKIISNDLQLNFSDYSVGEYFIIFRVDDEIGYKESQIKVTVADKISPEIEMVSSYIAYVGQPIELKATANYAENAEYVWRKNGEIVSEEQVYSFVEENLGSFALTVKVTTEEGVDIKALTVVVLPVPEAELYFDDGLYRTITNKNNLRKMTVPLDRTLVLAPVICHIDKPAGFKWTVDGVAQSSTTEFLKFTPT
ncbi:PKD-like domain-containing protein, partial [Dysgonomonas sp.]